MAKDVEPKLVTLADPRAIRALAHPARMQVIDVLYSSGRAMTATQLGELVGLSASAMSYHLRSLERFGVIRRAGAPDDGRERPWRRAGQSLNVAPSADRPSRATLSASSLLVSTAMDHDRAAIIAALERDIDNDRSVALDAVTRYQRNSLVVTPKEAKKLLKDIESLLQPYREESRQEIPAKAGRIILAVTAVSDPRQPGPPSSPGEGTSRARREGPGR